MPTRPYRHVSDEAHEWINIYTEFTRKHRPRLTQGEFISQLVLEHKRKNKGKVLHETQENTKQG